MRELGRSYVTNSLVVTGSRQDIITPTDGARKRLRRGTRSDQITRQHESTKNYTNQGLEGPRPSIQAVEAHTGHTPIIASARKSERINGSRRSKQ
jgi:hypothetical protein